MVRVAVCGPATVGEKVTETWQLPPVPIVVQPFVCAKAPAVIEMPETVKVEPEFWSDTTWAALVVFNCCELKIRLLGVMVSDGLDKP